MSNIVPKSVKDRLKIKSKSEIIEIAFKTELQYTRTIVALKTALAELDRPLAIEASLFQEELPELIWDVGEGKITVSLEGGGE